MHTNADLTLYSFKDNKYIRSEIKGVFWNEVKESNFHKTGLATADAVKIFIPLSNAPSLIITTGKDLIVKGIIDYDFDNTSQATQSASQKYIKDKYGHVTVTSCDKKLFGSTHMHHYVLSCK